MRYGGQRCRLRARSRGRYLQACSILAMAVALSRALPILHTAAACLSSKDLSSGLLPRLWRWKGPCPERFSHRLCLPILAGQPPRLCFWTRDLLFTEVLRGLWRPQLPQERALRQTDRPVWSPTTRHHIQQGARAAPLPKQSSQRPLGKYRPVPYSSPSYFQPCGG